MFKCGLCGGDSKPGEGAVMVVLERRRVNYPVRAIDGEIVDNGGTGYETVREVQAHQTCAKLHVAKAAGG